MSLTLSPKNAGALSASARASGSLTLSAGGSALIVPNLSLDPALTLFPRGSSTVSVLTLSSRAAS